MLRRLLLWALTRLFPLEEINGANRCPTYLYRWRLARCRRLGWALYLHRFVADDWSLDQHDHPKRFVSVGLSGSYVEHTPRGPRRFRAPWIRSFPAEHRHRVTLPPGRECWTLVLVFAATRPWGFWHLGRWIPWRDYVTGASSYVADEMVACK